MIRSKQTQAEGLALRSFTSKEGRFRKAMRIVAPLSRLEELKKQGLVVITKRGDEPEAAPVAKVAATFSPETKPFSRAVETKVVESETVPPPPAETPFALEPETKETSDMEAADGAKALKHRKGGGSRK